MDAAARLADKDPDFAARLVDGRLADPHSEVRARALVAERRLKRTPSAAVRKLLIDPVETVQVRAAEAVLDWVASTRKVGRHREEYLTSHIPPSVPSSPSPVVCRLIIRK